MKTINELSIAEVIKTDMFFNNMQELLGSLQSSRTKALYQYRGQVKAHPIDRLTDKGLFNAGDMIMLYAQVMDLKCRLARSERDFVNEVGTEVFLKTMKKIIEDEKRNNDRKYNE